jgi:hypothetical protein
MYQRTQTFRSANTNGYPRDIRHFIRDFNSVVNEHEAMQIKATGKPFSSSEWPPCSRCSVRIQQGNFVFDQRKRRSYNALHVASELEAFHRRAFTPPQIEAHQNFKRLLEDRSATSLIHRLGAVYARLVSKEEFVYLLDLLATMFFPGTLSWDFQCEEIEYPDTLGGCISFKGSMFIILDPIRISQSAKASYRPRDSDLNQRSIGRLGTLLHEYCHAFLAKYACQRCPGYLPDVKNASFHGFAWQRVALAVEFAAQNTLGLPIQLNRQASLVVNWPTMGWLPSREEVARWNLKGLRAHETVRDAGYHTGAKTCAAARASVQALENAKTESQLPKTADKHLSKRAQPRTLSGSSSAVRGKPMVVYEPFPEPPLYTTRYGRVIKPTQKLN